jgi:hypothetical protein
MPQDAGEPEKNKAKLCSGERPHIGCAGWSCHQGWFNVSSHKKVKSEL